MAQFTVNKNDHLDETVLSNYVENQEFEDIIKNTKKDFNNKIDKSNHRITEANKRINNIDKRFTDINKKMNDISKKANDSNEMMAESITKTNESICNCNKDIKCLYEYIDKINNKLKIMIYINGAIGITIVSIIIALIFGV